MRYSIALIMGLFLYNIAVAGPQLTPPEKGVGIYVYYTANDIPKDCFSSPNACSATTSTPFKKAYQAVSQQAGAYYIYLDICSLDYTESAGFSLNCPNPVNKDTTKTLQATYNVYQQWFGKETKLLPLIEVSSSATQQIVAGKSAAAVKALLAPFNQNLGWQQANSLAQDIFSGLSFDLEGGAAGLLSTAGEQFFKQLASSMPATKIITIYSGRAGDIVKNTWSLWYGLNRVDANGNLLCPSNSKQCSQGFWIYPLYDQSPDGTTFSDNTVTQYSKMATKYAANKLNAWNQAGHCPLTGSQDKKGCFIQFAYPASGSALNAEAFQSFEPISETQKTLKQADYWASQQDLLPLTCKTSDGSSAQNCHQYQQVLPADSSSTANVSQCEYLCTGLSGLTAIFNTDYRQANTGKSVCNVQVDYGVKYIPTGFHYDINQLVGIALYQIITPNLLYDVCTGKYPYKKCPKLIPYPESMPPSVWQLANNWMELLVSGKIDMPKQVCSTTESNH